MIVEGQFSNQFHLNRLYLNDKELNVVSYSLLLSVLEYQTAVMRGDFETADRVLPTVPRDHRTRVAHFLEKQVLRMCTRITLAELNKTHGTRTGSFGVLLV